MSKSTPGSMTSSSSSRTDNGNNDDDNDDDPWTYTGRNLRHLDFPLGGIGTGNILLQGDGCLRGWDIQNQFHSPIDSPLHNLPPLNNNSSSSSSNANCWAISAAYDEDEDEEDQQHQLPRSSFLLRSANHYGSRGGESGDNDKVEYSRDRHHRQPPDVPELSIRARYPIALVSYQTPPSFPLSNIQLEAMTPFVPTNAEASGYPMAVFVLTFTNPHSTKSVSVDVMQSTMNFIGWDGESQSRETYERKTSETIDREENANDTRTATEGTSPPCIWGGNINEPFVYSTSPSPADAVRSGSGGGSTTHSCKGLFLHTRNDLEKDLTRKGSIALSAICRHRISSGGNTTAETTTEGNPTPTVKIIKGVSSEDDLFRKFHDRDFEDIEEDGGGGGDDSNSDPTPPSPVGTTYIGAVVQSLSRIPPLSTATVTFCLSWHFPYRPCTAPRANLPPDFFGNLYATRYSDARDVAVQFCDTFSGTQATNEAKARAAAAAAAVTTITKTTKPKNLLAITRRFVESLYKSTIPWEILESAAGRLAIPRSPSMFQTEAGIVLGTVGNDHGPINATHVYGTTTLLERIVPSLSKDMLTSAFVRNFDLGSGGCLVSFGQGGFAIDGALACVIKAYLVVKQSDPGLDFLRTIWPNVKRQMEVILDNKEHLDTRDGVITGPQQTTYGGPMSGANTLVGSYLVTALKATEAMANLMGDVNFAKKCSKQALFSSKGYENRCWKEDFGYYSADVNESNCQDSYGTGCFLDQLVGSSLSMACGFGCAFDPHNEARARRSIVRNNVVTNPPFRDEDSILCPGDSGLRVCTYPHGKLGDGMPSSDKVSSGLVYPLVAGLIGDGNWKDAIRVCSFVRWRQSGLHKSPWNEPESGFYSARSMSGWNLFDQACGFTYDSTKASIGFSPKIRSESFSCFCAFHEGFGEFRQQQHHTTTTSSATCRNNSSNNNNYINGDGKFSFGTVSFHVLYGSTELQNIHLDTTAHVVVASLDGQALKASIDATGIVAFDTKIAIGEDSILTLTLSSPCYTAPSSIPIAIGEGKISRPLLSTNKTAAWHYERRNRMRFLGIIFVGISILYWWILCLLSFPKPVNH